jgi:ribosomal protein L24E
MDRDVLPQQAKVDADQPAHADNDDAPAAVPVTGSDSEMGGGVVEAQRVDPSEKIVLEDLPMGEEIVVACESEDVTYIGAAAGPYASYFVRSDGKVDRSVTSGSIETTLTPAVEGTKYMHASSGEYCSYFVRDDGVVVRLKSASSQRDINPPPGKKYIEVSSGEYASYLLLDDGTIHRTTGSAAIEKTIKPPKGVKYTAVSSGTHASYFLRSDGSVDRTKGAGKIRHTFSPPDGAKYIGVAAGEFHTYFTRDDGLIDCTRGYDKIHYTIEPPSGAKYISVSDMFAVTTQHSQHVHKDSPWQMYLVRDDGAVDRVVRWSPDKVQTTLNPAPGVKYVAATSGLYASYFVRSDGVIIRTKNGKINKKISAGQKDESNGCAIC